MREREMCRKRALSRANPRVENDGMSDSKTYTSDDQGSGLEGGTFRQEGDDLGDRED